MDERNGREMGCMTPPLAADSIYHHIPPYTTLYHQIAQQSTTEHIATLSGRPQHDALHPASYLHDKCAKRGLPSPKASRARLSQIARDLHPAYPAPPRALKGAWPAPPLDAPPARHHDDVKVTLWCGAWALKTESRSNDHGAEHTLF